MQLCDVMQVAQGFGFRLSILQPDGNTVSSEEAIAASAAMEEAGGAQDEQQGGGDVQGGEQAACVGDAKQEAPAKQRPKLGALPLQQLNVALDLDPTCASRIEVKSGPSPVSAVMPVMHLGLQFLTGLRKTRRPRPTSWPGSIILIDFNGLVVSMQAGVRPKLSLSIANRLSARALGSLGLIAKKPANAAASTAVAAARKR